jgi:hypothetical protein
LIKNNIVILVLNRPYLRRGVLCGFWRALANGTAWQGCADHSWCIAFFHVSLVGHAN